MPYINLKTNIAVADANDLQKKLGEAIRLIPGKTPERTMILIDDRQPLFFAGTAEPCIMVETQVNAETDQSHIDRYCFGVIDLLAGELGVDEKRIYVNVNAPDNWYAK